MKIFVIGSQFVKEGAPSHTLTASFERACAKIGESIAMDNHTLLLCSPFDDAADLHILRGAVGTANGTATVVEFHFVDTPDVLRRLNEVVVELGLTCVKKVPHPAPQSSDKQARSYAWLFCQLSALESSHATIAVGGNPNGAANMLLLLAEAKRKPVLPFPFFGGAAKQAYDRCHYSLEDRLGENFSALQTETACEFASKYALSLDEISTKNNTTKSEPPSFFISYARGRQAEADHVEMLLRRRNLRVFRDVSEFGAGHAIPTAISEAIHSATIFIALWSAEYACSPWCYDEIELALDRHAAGSLNLWLLRIDDTRIVPLRARKLLNYETPSRPELENKVLALLDSHFRAQQKNDASLL